MVCHQQSKITFHVEVSVVIFQADLKYNTLKILLEQDNKLPTHPLTDDNNFADQATKILQDRILVDNFYLEQVLAFGEFGRDGRDTTRERYITVTYLAVFNAQHGLEIKNNTWYSMDDLPHLDPKSVELLKYAKLLFYKAVKSSAMVYQLMPDMFTHHELYCCFKTLLGRYCPTFRSLRRKWQQCPYIVDTGKKKNGVGRSAVYYRFDHRVFLDYEDRSKFLIDGIIEM